MAGCSLGGEGNPAVQSFSLSLWSKVLCQYLTLLVWSVLWKCISEHWIWVVAVACECLPYAWNCDPDVLVHICLSYKVYLEWFITCSFYVLFILHTVYAYCICILYMHCIVQRRVKCYANTMAVASMKQEKKGSNFQGKSFIRDDAGNCNWGCSNWCSSWV